MVIAWCNKKRSKTVAFNATDILYGYKPVSNLFQALNHFGIIAKYHIFLSWLNKVSPSFEIFSLLLSEKIGCERTIAFTNNTLTKFKAKWTTLCTYRAAQNTISLGGCTAYVLFTSFFIFIYVLLGFFFHIKLFR